MFVENMSLKKKVLLLEEVQKLNKENAEKSGQQLTDGYLDLEAGVPPKDQQPDVPAFNLVDYLREDSQKALSEKEEAVEAVIKEEVDQKVQEAEAAVTEKEQKLDVKDVVKAEETPPIPEEKKEEVVSPNEEEAKAPAEDKKEKEPTITR